MAAPRIRNSYLHFGGRKGRKWKKRKQRGGLGFLAPIVASAVVPLATSLLNGVVGNGVNFFKMYSKRRIYFRTNGKCNCRQRYSTNNYLKKLDWN